jgi:hypothetical protein
MCAHLHGSSCCSAKFINHYVWPEWKKHAVNITSPRCLAAFQKVACFVCDPQQASFFSQQGISGSGKFKLEFDICETSCHTWYEDCKDDPGFNGLSAALLHQATTPHPGGTETGAPKDTVESEQALCKQIDAISSFPGLPAEVAIEIKNRSTAHPNCFLFDDLEPRPIIFTPANMDTRVSVNTQVRATYYISYFYSYVLSPYTTSILHR